MTSNSINPIAFVLSKWAPHSFIYDDYPSSSNVFIVLTLVYILYYLMLITYRLYWSPIAKFPGPKLAAATYWYEAYYDLINNGGGQFAFQIKRLHEKYGPVVRITPDELHIDDPDYYDVVFCNSTPSRPIDKIQRFKYRLSHPESTLSTVTAEEHKARRAAVAPFFSRNRVRSYNHDLQGIVDRISYRLLTEFKGSGTVIEVNHMWASLTADMIMELAFGYSANRSDSPGFLSPIPEAMSKFVYFAHYATHFQIIGKMIQHLPDRILNVLAPQGRALFEFRSGIRQHVREIKLKASAGMAETSKPTVFHDILASHLPQQDKSLERLTQEAMLVIGAGIETTTWTLTVATFHILFNPTINQHLKAELKNAMPDPDQILPWDELEKLPYLKAVVMESLRLSFGSVQRLPRVNRLSALKYHDMEIPPNVPIGMDAFHMHTNETIFPDPWEFQPERWLNDPKGPGGLKPLTQYVVSFSRGARGCVGMHLAMLELYVALATIFRRHDLELFEPNREDVDFVLDLVKPAPKPGSKGVRVLVR
ncbi:cytochrome P450 [Camillea tinctor]|nr:cytochrome P450 [Camillea tinctor]